MSYRLLLFSIRGRISRFGYWIGLALLAIVGFVSNMVAWSFYQQELSSFFDVQFGGSIGEPFLHAPLSNPLNLAIWIAQIVSALILLYTGMAVQTKRWHDRDKPGWWSLIVLIPIIGWIWLFVECGFLRGRSGPNRYGSDPLVDPVAALDGNLAPAL